jgi:N-methylhydantoinase A/oxoprolinase/acetone carboxylase beta subunit
VSNAAPSPNPLPQGEGDSLLPLPLREGAGEREHPTNRRVWLDGAWSDLAVFDFAALASGQALHGPAIVESETTTVLLRAGDTGRFDARGWLEIEVGGAATFE